MDEPTAASRQHDRGKLAAQPKTRGRARYFLREWVEAEFQVNDYRGEVELDGQWFHEAPDDMDGAQFVHHASSVIQVNWL